VVVRILFLIGIIVGIVLSGGTSVMAASNTTGNNTKSDVVWHRNLKTNGQ
jgi:uncharacterized protein YceK